MTHPRSQQRRCVRGSLAFIALAAASGAAVAQPAPALDRLDLSLGGYYASIDTTIGASTTNGDFRDEINLEDGLGFKKHQAVPRVRLKFLIGDSQGFSFDYFSVNRGHNRILGEDFDYGGNNYDTTTEVHDKLDFDFGSAAYRWWFGQGSNVFGLGLGGAWYRVQGRISANTTVNGAPIDEAFASTSLHAWAPELELGWRHAFNERWRMYADASGVKKNGGRLYGHIYNANLGAEWYPWKNFGFAAEYRYTRIKLDERRNAYNDSLDMRLKGPSVFMKLRF